MMHRSFGFALGFVVAFNTLGFAQEEVRTQLELEKLPMYERLLDEEDSAKAAELRQQYDEAIAAEDWIGARKHAEELLELRIARQGVDHYEVFDTRQLLRDIEIQSVFTADQRGQLAEINETIQQAIELQSNGEYQAAADQWEGIVTTIRSLLGEGHPDYATCLNNLAVLYMSAGEYTKAETLYLKACERDRELLGGNHPSYATSLNNLAVLHESMGEYARAEPLHLQARDMRKRLLGENSPEYAASLNNLAILYQSMGAYATAESMHLEARDLVKKLLGQEDPNYATSLDNLARLYDEMGSFGKAEPIYLQAYELRKKLLGENHPDYAISLNNLASFYSEMGEYAKAEPLNLRALDLNKNLLGEDHPQYALGLNNLAALYVGMGEYAKAEALYLEASRLRKQFLGESHPDFAASLNNLAVLYEKMEANSKAEPLYLQALDLRLGLFGEKHPRVATSINNLATLYRAQGKYSESQSLMLQALEMRKELLGEDHPDYGDSLNNLATLYQSTGRYLEAKPLFELARNVRKRSYGENHPQYATALSNLSLLHHAMHEYSEAESLLVECTRSYEMSRIARASGIQRAIGGDGQNPYFWLASVSARLGKRRNAFQAMERSLARAFLDTQAERRGLTMSSEQAAERDRILQELSPIEKRISMLVEREELTEDEQMELDERIATRVRLNVDLANLTTELSTQEVSDFAGILRAIPPSHAILIWVDALGGKGKGEVQEHWACVLTGNGEPHWFSLLGSGETGEWTDADRQIPAKLREALAQPVPPSDLPALIKQLRRQRVEPALKYLKEQGIAQLYVVGVNDMAGVPVEVIAPEFTISYIPSGTFLARLPKKPQFTNTLMAVGDPIYEVEKSRRFEQTPLPPHGLLIDAIAPGGSAEGVGLQPGQVLLQYAETKLTTIDDLKNAIQTASVAGAKTTTVIVWRGDGSEEPSEVKVELPVGPLGVILASEPAPLAISDRRKKENLLASLRGGDNWKDLPGTRYEVQQLKTLLPTATILLDSEANEVTLDSLRQTGQLSQFRYLHFATHGKGNSITAFESKLILSQDQPKEEIKLGAPWYNNEVSAREVLNFWKLNADLVTLSACQTGLGQQGGGEGLLGFAQAFLLSGARSVCLSLWEVDDLATALLMQRFYQNILGMRDGISAPLPKAQALEEAKQWLRNLSANEVTALTTTMTGGVARGNRGEKSFKLPEPATPIEKSSGGDYKPFDRPHYWSAFILVGEPE